jgi:hypothetical protein
MPSFWPLKYYAGLTKKNKIRRRKEIQTRKKLSSKDPSAYRPFETDVIKTKTSDYTRRFRARFPDAKSLEEKAKATGVPLSVIRECYNRGLAAWRTGHRPGATQQQWGYARVHSLLMCGKTHYTADADLVKQAKKKASAREFWKKCA